MVLFCSFIDLLWLTRDHQSRQLRMLRLRSMMGMDVLFLFFKYVLTKACNRSPESSPPSLNVHHFKGNNKQEWVLCFIQWYIPVSCLPISQGMAAAEYIVLYVHIMQTMLWPSHTRYSPPSTPIRGSAPKWVSGYYTLLITCLMFCRSSPRKCHNVESDSDVQYDADDLSTRYDYIEL